MLRNALLSTCLALGFCTACFGQVTLEHKFNEGSSYTVDTTVQTEQKLSIAGQDVDTSGDTRTTAKMTVGRRDAEGKLRVQEKVDAIKASIMVMGMNFQFDSANPGDKGDSQLEVLRDMYKALAQRSTTVVYDKTNRACEVESDLSIVNSLPTEIQGAVKGQLEAAYLKSVANDDLDQVKSDPLKPGDSWQRTRSANLGSGQMMSFQTEYTYAGTVEKDGRSLDKISSKTLAVNYWLENSPLPLSVKNSDLKAEESEGVILFDRQQGQIVESSSSVRVTGDLTFTINDMNLPAKLDLKIKNTMVVKP